MLILFLKWYFLEIPAGIKKIWGNYAWFFWRFFSIGRLARDFFAPWKGLVFKREKRSFEFGDAFSALFGNVFSSLMGALARLFFMAVWLLMELLAAIAAIAAFAAWVLLLPAIPLALAKGVSLLF